MSDNSSENSVLKEVPSDANLKLSRLATEYSKIRAQNSVLKKAVVEEQTKNVELNEKLKEKEQIIRKSNQEMESLNFRNLQLSKRIIILQEDLDNAAKNSKKKSKNTEVRNGVTVNSILDEELKKMTIEKAELQFQMNEKERKYEEEISNLKKQIYALNLDLEQTNLKLRQLLSDHQATIEQMKKEQQEFKREYAGKLGKLKETEVELSTLKNAHKSYVNEVAPKLEAVSEMLAKKIPFSDEEYAALNKLNVRVSSNSYEENVQTDSLHNHFDVLLLTFYNIIHNVTLELKQLGFEELKIYIKTLLKEDDGVLLNEKLNACYQLLKNIGLDCNNPESMEYAAHQFIRSFLDLSSSVYSSYMNKNSKIKSAGLVDYSNDVSIKNCLQLFQKKKKELIDKIMTLPNSQQALIEEEFESLNTAIENLVREIENIELKKNQNNCQKLADTYEYKKKASDYLRSIPRDKVEHIPYEEAIANRRKIQEYIMRNNSLEDEIHSLENSIVKLEKEKIDLQNEYRINLIKCNPNDIISLQNENDVAKISSEEIGKITIPHSISDEILAREEAIKNYLNEKINELIVLKQEASSKARTFMLECRVLQRRLENCVVEKQLLEHKYLKFNKTTLELQEELSTVSQNYELQLSMMSEHLANVNDKLASQTEEIENLNYKLSNKAAKKTKQK